jgi:small subunit ribosomal protein S18
VANRLGGANSPAVLKVEDAGLKFEDAGSKFEDAGLKITPIKAWTGRFWTDERMQKSDKKRGFFTGNRFPNRRGDDWEGPLVDYKEVELIRKFLTTSSKMMSRKRAGTNAQEQKALKQAVKQARFMALIPYSSV